MTRLTENQGAARVFERFRTSRGNCYRHVGAERSPAWVSKVVTMIGATVR